jgi:phenol 2-monooxygenase (NADPH)
MPKSDIEISDLPPLLQDSRWTFYLDDIPEQDTRGSLCTNKWLGSLGPGEVAIVTVRPDGYVGSLGRWDTSVDDAGEVAAKCLDTYFDRFLQIPEVLRSPSPNMSASATSTFNGAKRVKVEEMEGVNGST